MPQTSHITTCEQDACKKPALSSSHLCRTHHKQWLGGSDKCHIVSCANAAQISGYCRNHYMVACNKGATCKTQGCSNTARTANLCPTCHKRSQNGWQTCAGETCVNLATRNGLCSTHHAKGTQYKIGADRGYDPLAECWVYHVTNGKNVGKIGISQNLDARLADHRRQGLDVVIRTWKLETWIMARKIETRALTQLRDQGAKPALHKKDTPYGGHTETWFLLETPDGFDMEQIVETVKTETLQPA